ncbi:hypothetical protein [uncultured Clostridium sp.]|uniref:hypothetical protein n=1 Tax=uncultured Clostridium sp. TaxID=59620 RepID=UPI00280C1153|nr:hypothetical protein [uncultured Clostridium sp.]
MYFKKIDYTNEMEILFTEKNLVTFTHTLVSADIVANSEGRKLVLAGSLITNDGKVVKQTGNSGAEQLSGTPVGVLYRTVDVTNGDMPCSLVVEGYLRADRVLDSFAETKKTEIKTALPKITFR